ncbi:MAG: transporter, YjgP/YjgQ family [Acidobacteria bacterium]|nr:transporter, YjgP/YjgQ family [Acidobacteriota bacterium]
MKILTRYIFKEMVGPTLLGFSFYTFIVLMNRLFLLAGMIIRRSLPAETVGKLLLLSIPYIVVLTVPMSILFGVLIAVGRLSADSEIIAMRALGISMRTIYRPVFVFTFLVFLIALYLINVVMPRGSAQLEDLQNDLLTSSVDKEIKPRVFYDNYEDVMIYVNDVDPRSGRWNGIFLADNRTSADERDTSPQAAADAAAAQRASDEHGVFGNQRGGTRIVVAEGGFVSSIQPAQQVWLNLNKTTTHVWDPRKPDHYDLNSNNAERILLSDRGTLEARRVARSFRSMNLRELREQVRLLRYTPDRESYRMAKVEIHKKFSLPFACLVFGVLGLPLGISNRRGGKSSGFTLSLAIIMGYWVMITNGEQLAVNGTIGPAVGMWAPNLIFLAFGIWLLLRANQDTGASRSDVGFFARIFRAIRREKSAPAATSNVNVSESQSILSRLDITFPNILDRYVLREFLKMLFMIVISTAVLITIVDYTQISADVRENHIAFHTVFAYYRFMFFQIVSWTLPISVLVATLVTFGIFSKNNEVTAFKSGGVSLYRVALPVVAVAIVIGGLSYLLSEFVLPYSNQRMDQLRNKIKGKKTVATASQQKLWFAGKGRYIINFLSYDRNTKELGQVQVFELHPTVFRLTRRVYAQRAKWDGTGWVFQNGWIRSFSDDGRTATYTPIGAPVRLFYAERPEDFETEVKTPEQMTYGQLRRYIDTVRQSGYAADALLVRLYMKTSWPFLSVVMALIALPFAFRVGKRGALYGVGIGLVLGIAYWMIFATCTKLGEVGNLPALLSAWAANILFAIAAVYMFLHVET